MNGFEQYKKQIKELKSIIQHKENLIKTIKKREIENEKFLAKSNSSFMKFENNEFLNENITKLISDNEENKMKIEFLNDKLKTIDEIEQKYFNFMKVKKIIPKEKDIPNIPSLDINPRDRRYNNTNHKLFTSRSNKNDEQKSFDKHVIKNLKNNFSIKNIELIGRDKNQKNLMINSLPLNTLTISITDRNEIKNKNNKQFNDIKSINTTLKDNYDKNKNNVQIQYSKNNKNDRKQDIKGREIKTFEVNINNLSLKERKIYKKEDIKIIELKKQNSFERKDRKIYHAKEIEEAKSEIKEPFREINKRKYYSYIPKIHNYSEDEVKLEQNINIKNNIIQNKNKITYYLYGIDRNNYLHIFDISNKLWIEKKKILEIKLNNKSDSFKKDYQYEGTLLYNTLEGVYILTGEKTDTLYYFNSKTNSISKICKFNDSHNNGSIMYDKKSNCLYAFGGKKITSCEYYSFSTKKIYKLPDLTTDRANASFIISNNKIFGFFGFSYLKHTHAKTIEYIDYNKRDKWVELNDIKLLKNNIKFDIEGSSIMYYKQNKNKIFIYSGIQGENGDIVTQYYLLFDAKNNTMDKINKWNSRQYKYIGKQWKEYEVKINDSKDFHFEKNSKFILLPKNVFPEGYNSHDIIYAMIDYKNNIHFVSHEKQQIDIYRGEI